MRETRKKKKAGKLPANYFIFRKISLTKYHYLPPHHLQGCRQGYR